MTEVRDWPVHNVCCSGPLVSSPMLFPNAFPIPLPLHRLTTTMKVSKGYLLEIRDQGLESSSITSCGA
jgi:hypothetical protein